MADQQHDPHEEKVETVPLPAEDGGGGDEVIRQENMNPEVAMGGGEWPSPQTPPTGPTPEAAGADAGADRAEVVDEPDRFPPAKETLAVDPVAGGSGTVPEDDQSH